MATNKAEITGWRRALGANDITFNCEDWSVFLNESHDGDMTKSDRRFVFNGEFSNWPLWKKKVTARLVSHRLDAFDHDENGRPICGLLTWKSEFHLSRGVIEGFENGNIEVSSVITPEIFDSVLTLLRESGTHLVATFTLSNELPETWNGSEPIRINSVKFWATGH